MKPVSHGLVGYGFGGRYFHAPLLQSAIECEFVGIVTTSAERKALIAKELPGTRTFESLQHLVDAGAEAVTVCTPAATHSELTEQALRAGLAVVCDKPFALDAPSARHTVELAEQLGLPLSPYQNRRWDSDFRTLRRLLEDGKLGEITRFESRFERYAPANGPGVAGGGTLLDFGSHLVDQALFLLGPVVSVYAEHHIRESGLDDEVFLVLHHESGARSHLGGSWSQFAPGPRFRVTGTRASFVLANGDTQEDALVAGTWPDPAADNWGIEPAGSAGRLFSADGSELIESERGRWDTFYPAFARAVRGAGPVPVPARNAVATAVVLEAADASARSGAVVSIPRE